MFVYLFKMAFVLHCSLGVQEQSLSSLPSFTGLSHKQKHKHGQLHLRPNIFGQFSIFVLQVSVEWF